MKFVGRLLESVVCLQKLIDVEITKQWYGETIDGKQLKEKEASTSHSIDVENMRMANGKK